MQVKIKKMILILGRKIYGLLIENLYQKGLAEVVAERDLTLSYDEKLIEGYQCKNIKYELTTSQYITSSNKFDNALEDLKVLNVEQLRQSTEETSTFMIELDSKEAGMTYQTAETLAIFPENRQELVEKLANFEHWELDKKFVLIGNDESILNPFPSPITVREALTKFCDLTGLLLYVM